MEYHPLGTVRRPDYMTRDLYTLLGVSATASAGELRRAFRAKARATHPDRAGRGTAASRTAEMAELNAAYTLLSDPLQRAAYDQERMTSPSSASVATPAPAAHGGSRPRATRRTFRFAPSRSDLFALPGSFLGYTLLPIISPGTTSLAGAAWGAILAIAAGRLAARNGQLEALAHRLRHR